MGGVARVVEEVVASSGCSSWRLLKTASGSWVLCNRRVARHCPGAVLSLLGVKAKRGRREDVEVRKDEETLGVTDLELAFAVTLDADVPLSPASALAGPSCCCLPKPCRVKSSAWTFYVCPMRGDV